MEHLADRHGWLPPRARSSPDLALVIVVAAALIACRRIWTNPRGDAGEQAVWLTAPLFAIVILCTSFSWGYYCLLLVPLGFVSLRQDRVADWAVRLGVFLALAPRCSSTHYPATRTAITTRSRITFSGSVFCSMGLRSSAS